MTIVKCRFCKTEIDRDTAYKVGKNSYYCDNYCYSRYMEDRDNKKKKYKPKDNTDRRKLTDYIQNLYIEEGYEKSEINWVLLMSQVKNFIEEYGYKYSGIKYCLWYMKEIENINLFNNDFNGSVLNLIPYYYEKSKQYWKETNDIKKEIKNFDFNNKIIKIKGKNIDKRKNKMIKMEDLM